MQPSDVNYSGGSEDEQPSALAEARAAAVAGDRNRTRRRGGRGRRRRHRRQRLGERRHQPGDGVKGEDEKIGRNDPCWCGSGKKFKKCHGA